MQPSSSFHNDGMSSSQAGYFGREDDSWMMAVNSQPITKQTDEIPVAGSSMSVDQVASTSRLVPMTNENRLRPTADRISGSLKGKERAVSPPAKPIMHGPRAPKARKREYHQAFPEKEEDTEATSTNSTPASSPTLLGGADSRHTSFTTVVSTSPVAKLRKTDSHRFVHWESDGNLLHQSVKAPAQDQTIGDFMDALWGQSTGLEPFIIAHDQSLQTLFDQQRVPWSTQFELQRGQIRRDWTIDEIKSKIGHFSGQTDAAVLSRVRSIMKGASNKAVFDDSIGQESDREQLAIEEGVGRGLGLMGEWHGATDWYGGRIQQVATLIERGEGFVLNLEPLEMQRSTRIARFLGSRRLIQIRMSKALLQKSRSNVIAFLQSHKLILNGRVFIPLPPKDRVCYAVEINEDYERSCDPKVGDQFRLSFREIMDWHNPMSLNSRQPIRKFFARYALGFSNSVPVLEFPEENIHSIDDILIDEEDLPADKKPQAEKIHTDGSGIINLAAAKLIASKIDYYGVPTAMQGRIGGAKGLWIISFDNFEDTPHIWIRKSQSKIEYASLDRGKRIFDLLEVSHPSSNNTCFLSQQSVLNLYFNGVPASVFEMLMKEDLENAIRPLMDWTSPHSDVKLFDEIEKSGRVMSKRLQVWSASLSRVLGHSGRYSAAESGELDVDEDQENPRVDVDTAGGAPASLHDCAAGLVKNGFSPTNCKYLQDKLRFIVRNTIDAIVEKCRIALPAGTAIGKAFVIPDPTGLLEADEIYFRSSTPLVDPDTKTIFQTLEGDVVIGRYPTRLPSDLQMPRAVNKPELERYTDVVIVPTKGTLATRLGWVTFMTLLGGGDVDGDTAFLIWFKPIVESFRRKSLSVPSSATFEQDNFFKEVETVTDFIARLSASPKSDARTLFQQASLSGIADESVGIYSHWHDIAVWKHGYGSKKAIRLAYMFNTLLDGTKTGLIVLPDVYKKDKKEASLDKPLLDRFEPSVARLSLKPKKDRSILDILAKYGQDLRDKFLVQYRQETERSEVVVDPDLLAPWKEATSRKEAAVFNHSGAAVALQHDLDCVQKHVDGCMTQYRMATAASGTPYKSPSKSGRQNAAGLGNRADQKSKSDYTHVVASFAQAIPGLIVMSGDEAERVKVSYAFSLSVNFAFCVAYVALCDLKSAASSRGRATSTVPIDEARSVPSSVRKIFDMFDA
ncbi:RNA dependent RNA polymerase-domain-containing protein [Rhodocollybia butyracea]|uniref:RNA-dependent RNA polymerase n=1 Tax=Rhodocollybia butyracea TaxID=206335 RepID=A0A9P5PY17_9AGAR|nr:RNA dependent RNA polymerase-domain-containing protein [Rhodocollybia butyracea]